MEYEKELRETAGSTKITQLEIQEKLGEKKYLSELKPFSKLEVNDKYISLDIDGLNCLKEMITDDDGKALNGKKVVCDDIDSKIKKKIKDIKEKKHQKVLDIDESKLDNFKCVKEYDKFKQLSIKGGANEKDLEELKEVFNLSNICLKSKQCNEPYEILLSELLRLMNIDDKHGFDAILREEDGEILEKYEYKPSSNKNNPSGTINDDSIEKIEKCEKLKEENMKGWLILAGIDKKNFTFDTIYKFPLEIYNEDRRKYFDNLKLKNSNKEKQTRSTYGINIKRSIEFCNELNLDYYVWKR